MTINVTGILRSPQGTPIQNAELLFEQSRTSTEVIAGTKFSIITDQQGNYQSTLGIGTFVFKVRFSNETEYRTIASNIIVTPEMGGYSINEIIITQQALEDIDYDLLKQVLEAKNEAVQASEQAKDSQQEAKDSASQAKDSETAAKQSETAAKQSETAAKQSETASKQSEAAAQQSQQEALTSKNSALASATLATQKADQAAQSQQQALASKTQAQDSQQQALQSERQQKSSEVQQSTSEQQAAVSQSTASVEANQSAASQQQAANSEATAISKASDAQASQEQAQQSYSAAADKATQAQGSQSSASSSQNTAIDKAQQSASSALLSQKWAANPEDVEVSNGLFSALHYAAKAAQYAQVTSGQLIWRGGWSAQAGNPPVTPVENTQDFYRITQAGTILGVVYDVGDYIHWDPINSIWFKMDGTDSVTSINGRPGAVVLTKSDVGLSQVNNWGASSQVNDGSTSTYATTAGVKAAYDLASSKLDANATAVAATKLATARSIGGVLFDGTASIDLPGVNIGGNQNTTGNAATSTKLATARSIGGVLFDGSANIALPGVNIQGTQNTTGNAATASKLAVARSISISGGATGTITFDGSKDVIIPLTVLGSEHTHAISNIVGLQESLSTKYSPTNKPTSQDIGALPISGGDMLGTITVASRKSAIKVDNQKSISYQDNTGTMYHTMAYSNSFLIAHGTGAENPLLTLSTGSAGLNAPLYLTPPQGATGLVINQTPNAAGGNALGIIGAYNGKHDWSVGSFYSDGIPQYAYLGAGVNAWSTGLRINSGGAVYGSSLIQSQFFRAETSGNPRMEMHVPGKFAVMQWIDGTNGTWNFSSSNGAGGETSRLASFDSSGVFYVHNNLTTQNRVISNNPTVRSWSNYGVVQFFGQSSQILSAGNLQGTISSEYRTANWALEMGLGQYLETGAADTLCHTLFATDGGSYAKFWRFYNDGRLFSPQNAQNWSLGSGGMLTGTTWGGQLDTWIRTYFAPISDIRYKHSIEDSTVSALDTIGKIKFRSYQWKDDAPVAQNRISDTIQIGIIAQELQEVNPILVRAIETFDSTGQVQNSTLALDTTNLLSLALKANQELLARIAALEERITRIAGQ